MLDKAFRQKRGRRSASTGSIVHSCSIPSECWLTVIQLETDNAYCISAVYPKHARTRRVVLDREEVKRSMQCSCNPLFLSPQSLEMSRTGVSSRYNQKLHLKERLGAWRTSRLYEALASDWPSVRSRPCVAFIRKTLSWHSSNSQ